MDIVKSKSDAFLERNHKKDIKKYALEKWAGKLKENCKVLRECVCV